MRRTIMVVTLAAALILALGAFAVYADSGTNFVAHLQGDNEVPVNDSLAQGQAVVNFNANSVDYRLNVANIENVTMAHIHVAAAPGASGPPAVWLYPAAPPPSLISGRSDGTLMAGTFTTTNFVGPLAGKSLEDLKTAIVEGRAYVNVHTSAYPGGEIRGDLH